MAGYEGRYRETVKGFGGGEAASGVAGTTVAEVSVLCVCIYYVGSYRQSNPWMVIWLHSEAVCRVLALNLMTLRIEQSSSV